MIGVPFTESLTFEEMRTTIPRYGLEIDPENIHSVRYSFEGCPVAYRKALRNEEAFVGDLATGSCGFLFSFRTAWLYHLSMSHYHKKLLNLFKNKSTLAKAGSGISPETRATFKVNECIFLDYFLYRLHAVFSMLLFL